MRFPGNLIQYSVERAFAFEFVGHFLHAFAQDQQKGADHFLRRNSVPPFLEKGTQIVFRFFKQGLEICRMLAWRGVRRGLLPLIGVIDDGVQNIPLSIIQQVAVRNASRARTQFGACPPLPCPVEQHQIFKTGFSGLRRKGR